MSDSELRELLMEAVGLIRKEFMVRMGCMAVDSEIERSWQHYISTTPEMVRIMRELNQ